jgi:hypothetical protein
VGHHPHGLADSAPIVEFIAKHAVKQRGIETAQRLPGKAIYQNISRDGNSRYHEQRRERS